MDRSYVKVQGFTLLELLVIVTIIGLLSSISYPRYFSVLDRSRDAVLHQNILALRSSISFFYDDRGSYPSSIDDIITLGYLREIPIDPITLRSDSWVFTMDDYGSITDVHSGASGVDHQNKEFSLY